jgi:hypothetical protein
MQFLVLLPITSISVLTRLVSMCSMKTSFPQPTLLGEVLTWSAVQHTIGGFVQHSAPAVQAGGHKYGNLQQPVPVLFLMCQS